MCSSQQGLWLRSLWVHHADTAYGKAAGFVCDRIGERPVGWECGTVMLVGNAGRIVAGVLFHNWQPENGVVQISAASDSKRWLTRQILKEMFAYAFETMGAQAVVACMDAGRRLVRIFEAYGFKKYEIPRLRGRDRAEAIMVLGDDEWKSNGFHKETANG